MLPRLEYAALSTAARPDGPPSYALVALLGMLGLRVSQACGADITDLYDDSRYELLTIMGKGRKPARHAGCARGHHRPAGQTDPAQWQWGPDEPRLSRWPAAPADQ